MLRILVPVDFSRNTNAGIRYAVNFALHTKSTLIFFHCSEVLIPTGSSKESFRNATERDLAIKEKRLIKKIDLVRKSMVDLLEGVPTEYVVSSGGVVTNRIIEAVKEQKADLLIMATHGASGLKKLFMGSVTSEIIGETDVPVLAIPIRYRYKPINTIVYACDMKNFDGEVFQVLTFSNLIGATVEVLTFNHPVATDRRRREKLKGCAISYSVLTLGDTSLLEHLKNHLKSRAGAVLCMFTGQQNWWNKLIGSSKTKELAMQLTFPLLAFSKTGRKWGTRFNISDSVKS